MKKLIQHIKKLLLPFSPENLKIFVLRHPLYIELIEWMKRTSFPGFFKVPIYDIVVFLWNELSGYSLTIRSNSIAYSFFIALFPALLVLFTLIPYFSDLIYSLLPQTGDLTSTLVEQLNLIIPGIDIEVINEDALNHAVSNNILADTLADIIETPRYGLLSLGFFLALFFSSNGMLNMMYSFEKAHEVTFRKQNSFSQRLSAIGLTFIIGFLLLASVLLIVLGNIILSRITTLIDFDWFAKFSFMTLRMIVVVSLFYFGIALIYRYGTSTYRRFGIFTPGATLATMLFIIISMAFGYYIENFSQYNKLYGSIGTVIILLLWLQLSAFSILVGFELNAAIAVNRDLKAKREKD